MTIPADSSFGRITDNNLSIELFLEDLVNAACISDEARERPDRDQILKTSNLLFLSSLILGENDMQDHGDNEG